MENTKRSESTVRLDQLRWLEDAPLFSDPVQVGHFHDAIVRPPGITSEFTYEITEERSKELKGELGIEGTAGVGLPKFLTPLLSGKAELKGSGTGSIVTTSSDGRTVSATVMPIRNAERQLQDVIVEYLLRYKDRLFFSHETRAPRWTDAKWIRETPRPLVFLSLPSAVDAEGEGRPHTKLVPTAAEFEDGKIVEIYKTLDFGEELPPYPQKGAELELVEKRKDYWAWFEEKFSPTAAMVAVEGASRDHGRIQWIDYRLPLEKDGTTLHIHVCPRGQYATGDFAYNLIKRGYKHGIRLVGTLKSEPDMNVLAIYER